MNERLKQLRKHYPGMPDADIQKAGEKIEYVIYDKATNEIIQAGDMDMLAFEKHLTEPTEGKMIIDNNSAWKLRGEFTDIEGNRMFKVRGKSLMQKPEHNKAIEARRMPQDKD